MLLPCILSLHIFLTLSFLNILYQFTCLPQGLTSAPRNFTKVIKAVLSYLRSFAIKIAAWLDDYLLAAKSAELVKEHTSFTLSTLQELGFVPNFEKSASPSSKNPACWLSMGFCSFHCFNS